jgi:bacillolysin
MFTRFPSPQRLWTAVALAIVVPWLGLAQQRDRSADRSPWADATRGRQGIAASTTPDLRRWDNQVQRMLRGGDLKVRLVEEDPVVTGRVHEHLDQFYNDVRVFGGDLTRQSNNGQVVSVFGELFAGITIDTTPALTPEDAALVVQRESGTLLGPARRPELMVLPQDTGRYVLAYRARVLTPHDLRVYFVDARTGAVVFDYSDLKTVIGSGTGVLGDPKKVSTTSAGGRFVAWDQMRPASIYTYDMGGNLQRTQDFVNGLARLSQSDLSADSDNQWADPATVDAHAYAGWTYDFYYKRFSRQGLDNRNLAMTSLVHPVRREDARTAPSNVFGLYYLNAFYAGDGIMVYGEGLPSDMTSGGANWNYFSGALDVVAHELTHGVTDYTSNLVYLNEPGALNEAFSDIMGTSVEFFFQPAGIGYLKADYLIGEDLTSPSIGFRSMANPQAFGDPDHYSRRYLGTADNGGVHRNSGIANNAFYLAVEGGVNRTSGIAVTGVGSANRDQIEKVFYRAFTQLLPSGATFSVARAACEQAARDLYGAGGAVERAVREAWVAVGVS